MRLRKGDRVQVIAGKDKGRKGKVEQVLPAKNAVVIPGINMYKKNVRKTDKNKGGIIEFTKPLDVAKVSLVCPQCKQMTRIGFTLVGDNKERVCKKCQKII